MKLKNSVEQAICLLIMIAHSDEKAPLKSYNISKSLGVSDSYLKKNNSPISSSRFDYFRSR